MVADPLTKGGRNAEELMKVFRSGVLNVPGGSSVVSSTRINSSSWKKLLEAQSESFQPMTTLGQLYHIYRNHTKRTVHHHQQTTIKLVLQIRKFATIKVN